MKESCTNTIQNFMTIFHSAILITDIEAKIFDFLVIILSILVGPILLLYLVGYIIYMWHQPIPNFSAA